MTDQTETAIITTDVITRRSRLCVDANPGIIFDYLNFLQAEANSADARITVRYVPDKQTLPPAAFDDYLSALESFAAAPLERLAVTILEDINNEVVPRWVQVVAERNAGAQGYHRVLMEDRQPKWDNAALLARLERY